MEWAYILQYNTNICLMTHKNAWIPNKSHCLLLMHSCFTIWPKLPTFYETLVEWQDIETVIKSDICAQVFKWIDLMLNMLNECAFRLKVYCTSLVTILAESKTNWTVTYNVQMQHIWKLGYLVPRIYQWDKFHDLQICWTNVIKCHFNYSTSALIKNL